ncbi:MAG: HAD-IB family phosphatase [Bacteroidia bacterium]|nr:HAD-IB family phosphatase [Bacteroidia bacterium]
MEQKKKQKKGVAFFDFDGTISFKDSFLEFIKYSKGKEQLILCVIINAPFVLLYYIHCYSNHKLKERFFSYFFKNCSEVELTEKGNLFSQNQLPKICYPSALLLIQWHKEQNHDIYILTASSSIWLNNWCKTNHLKLIATEFETMNGVYTGKIVGKNCHGQEKENRIKDLFLSYNWNESYGYGNEKSDRFYLNKMRYKLNAPLNEKNVHAFLKGKV